MCNLSCKNKPRLESAEATDKIWTDIKYLAETHHRGR